MDTSLNKKMAGFSLTPALNKGVVGWFYFCVFPTQIDKKLATENKG